MKYDKNIVTVYCQTKTARVKLRREKLKELT